MRWHDERRRRDPTVKRDLVTRHVTVRADTVRENDRSVEAVLATERPTTVLDFERFRLIDEVLLMDGARLPAQAVLLDSHARFDLSSVLGSIREMRADGDQLIGRLFFAEGDEAAERAWQLVRQGHLTDVSVGYRVEDGQFVDIEPGTTATVNGREFTADKRVLRVTLAWTLREGSLVPIGADDLAKVRAAARAAAPQEVENTAMPQKLRQYLESIGLDPGAGDEEAKRFALALTGRQATEARRVGAEWDQWPAAPEPTRSAPTNPAPADPEPAPRSTATDVDAARAEAQRAERERVRAIHDLAGDDETVPAELVRRAIHEGWDLGRASQEFLRAVRGQRSEPVAGDTPAIHSRADGIDDRVRAMAFALGERVGNVLIDERAPRSEREAMERAADGARQYRGVGLREVVVEACRLRGLHVASYQDALDQISRPINQRAATSTLDVANIFTTNINARLMQRFMEAPDSTQGWVRERDVSNFQTQERLRLGKVGAPDLLPRGDEAKHGTIADALESYKIARYAKQFRIDEQDIIDDNLNALQDIPDEAAAAMARLRPDLVYAILLANANMRDGVALFHAATHGNLDSTATALNAARLEVALADMMKQTEDGVILNVEPRFMLVPPELKFTAQTIITSAERRGTGSDGIGTRNPLQDETLVVRSDARLTAGVTDPATKTFQAGSATAWYLAADPGSAPTIEVGYRAGTARRPQVRMWIMDRGSWGVGWDFNMDIGAKALDWRGLYKAVGA